MGERSARHVQAEDEQTSDEDEEEICEIVSRLIPVVEKRVLGSLERSPEDLEPELATLSNILSTGRRFIARADRP